jgi:serine-aspartate repeat-containing protein C/D/E
LDSENPNDPDNDFRFEKQLATVGDRVWFDDDGDGVQDADEDGISGVTVNLTDCSGNVVATDVTDDNGNYLFAGVAPATYCVVIAKTTLPGNVLQTFEKDGSLDGNTQQPLNAGDEVLDVDFGYQPLGSIGDTVWRDDNGNGVQDPGEPGIPDVKVNLNDPGNDGKCGTDDDVLIASDVTDNFLGGYLFVDLPQGVYCVDPDENTVPDNYLLTTNNDPQTVELGPGEEFLDADFGYQPLATVGDRVWFDDDGDGVQDADEDGISGVTVNLTDCSGNVVATDVTDGNGNYLFAGVAPATYCVVIAKTTLPGNVQQTFEKDGSLDGNTQQPLNAGDEVLDVDFGYQPLATVGDRVWFDDDGDGVQDADEDGISGVTVNLTDCSGNVVATDVTDGNGNYLFAGVAPATYCVVIAKTTLPGNVQQTFEKDGSLDGNTQQPLNAGDEVLDVDFGYQPLATVGDRVWFDDDGDGVQDADEDGISGVTVNLTDCSGNVVATDVTDGNGNYLFAGVAPATYCVVIAKTTLPGNVQQTFEKDGSLDGNTQQPLNAGDEVLDVDFGYQPLTCGLTIDKTCVVQQPVSTQWSCSDAKPINQLWMIWNGTQPAKIKAWKGDVGSTLLETIDNIQPGDKVTVSGYAGSPNDVYWEVFAAGTDTKLGESAFHLSCSDSNMNGPEDCGLPQGNNKGDEDDLLNLWLLEGMAGSDQSFLCNPEPQAPTDSCSFTLGDIPSCELLDKPASLTFKYTGEGCDASDNTQDPDKATCTGSVGGSETVTVMADNDDYLIAPMTVAVDEEFTVSADGFDSNSVFILTGETPNGPVQETNEIHTSCSQPLAVGDVFGSLELVAFNGQRAGSEVTYFYEVANTGDDLTSVTVTDDVLGAIAGPFNLAADQTQTFEASTDIYETSTNTAFVSGLLAGGAICPVPAAQDSVTVTVEEPCDVCKGGTTELTLQYQGVVAANVTVYDKSDDSDAKKILFQGSVRPGEEITVTPRSGQDKLNNDVSIYVDGVFNAKIHTSCSKPIGPGLVAGDFEVTEARSKDNGLMCALNTCDPQAADSLVFDGDKLKWDVTNNGDLGLEVERITINWPAEFGDLIEMKVNGTFFKGALPAPSAVVDSGWDGNVDDRTIPAGDTKRFEFKFENDVSLVGDVEIIVKFTTDCSISVD